MAAFYFYKKGVDFNKELLLKHFESLKLTKYSLFNLGDYRLLLFRKQHFNIDNYYEEDDYSIFAVGSFFYKSLGYAESLKQLLVDFKEKKLELDKLYGNYVFFFQEKQLNKITFLADSSFIKNVYFDSNNKIISSNFLAITESKPYFYKWNKLALYESVLSGFLVPPDTYAEGVKKLMSANIKEIDLHFDSIETIKTQSVGKLNFQGFDEAVDHANGLLINYFKSAQTIEKEFNSHIGLTGGFDSRLLLLHAQSNLKGLNTNSFFRENSEEYLIAKELAEIAAIDFKTYEFNKVGRENIEINKYKAYLFLDGQIRSQNYFNEEFNMPSYGDYLYEGHLIGFHGCGGEQYRNADRFIRKTNFNDFILDEWLLKQSGDIYIKNNLKSNLIDNITSKVRNILSYNGSNIDLLMLKRIQNEIWNPANRVTRVNALNQQMLYFSPFTEWQLSLSAYSYVSYLGSNSKFQIEMMRRISSDINNVKTTYGYSVKDGPGFKTQLISRIASLMPRKRMLQAYRLYKQSKASIPKDDLYNAAFFLTELDSEIDVKKLVVNPYIGKNLVALETVLKNMKLTN